MQSILLRIENSMSLRLNSAVKKSPFVSRMEFIRHLLDKALTDFERENAIND